MADIPTVYQKRSKELTIVSADVKDGVDSNGRVKKLPMSSGVSEAGKLLHSITIYRDRVKSFCVVATKFFMLLLNCLAVA